MAKLAPYLGLGLYHAWLSLSFYTTALFTGLEGATEIVNGVWTLGALGFALAMAVFLMPWSRGLCSWVGGHKLVAMSTAASVTTAGTLLTIVAGLMLGSPGLIDEAVGLASAGTAIAGFSSGCLVVFWGGAYVALRPEALVCLTFGSRVVAACVYLAVGVLPDGVRPAAVAVLPLLSGLLLVFSVRNGSQHTFFATPAEGLSGRKPVPQFSWRLAIPLASLFLYALGGEMLRGLCLSHESLSVDVMGAGYTVSIGATAAVLFVCALAYGRKSAEPGAITRFIRPATFFMALAFIAFACLNVPAWVSYGVFGIGFFCMNTFAWLLSIDVARRFRLAPLPVVALGQIPASFAPCLLPVLQPVVATLSHSQVQSLNMVAMLFSCLVFAIALFMLSPKDVATVWGVFPEVRSGGLAVPSSADIMEAEVSDERDASPSLRAGEAPKAGQDNILAPREGGGLSEGSASYSERFASLAAEYGLTKRETEVAELLARGRNLPYVEEVLVISHGTAQTHARHIYQKMAVHTRQEFIDLVDHLIDQGKQ